MRRLPPRIAIVSILCAASLGGCAHSLRPPTRVAHGEIVATMEPNLALRAEGRVIARSPTFRGLAPYVGCAPAAQQHATLAERNGRRARVFSILGASLGLGALVGFAALGDRDHATRYLGLAAGSGTAGMVFAGLGRARKRDAIGHALDAANEYDDLVGSLGATCAALRYPAPAGPPSPLPYPTLGAPDAASPAE